ncbi:acyltransferase family protein [Cellulomonas sp. C5510]|uniref:acyltransferase family protein n=1 Tax=Cellulomonas sp. C5510 TaxID=2871170 RepID=UPI001C95D388|nr:acyltransferase family protein [Cellulomonas sp. C5510]QZN84754.1 acyltransferase [Cellulomonas sp. C5510]
MSTVLPSRPTTAPAPAGPPSRDLPHGALRRDGSLTRSRPLVGAAAGETNVLTPAVPAGARRRGRDGFVDAVRAVGILVVVALHWLMLEAVWDGGTLEVGNALGHGPAWLLTWLQPLPLLFFAAGAAARYDLERGPAVPGLRFAGVRLLRMAPPVAVLVAVWAGLVAVLPRVGVPEAAVDRVARIVPQPLWFVGVQLALLALAPTLVATLRRWGAWRVLVVAAALPLVVDLLRFSDELPVSGWPNLLLVWTVPFVAGLVHAGRRLRPAPPAARAERPVLALLAAGGLAAAVALIAVGPYPSSMIGLPGEAVSNLAPPTAPVVGFAVAQVAGALLLREPVARWAGRSRVVRWVGPRSMGLYLWHLSAVFAVAGVVLLAVGRELPVPWTWDWWLTRPAYLGAAAVVLLVLLRAAAGVERLVVPRRRVVAAA